MDWQTRKELKEKLEVVMKDYWAVVDPDNEGTLHPKNAFVRELDELCRLSDFFTLADSRSERYAEEKEQDKKVVQELDDELLQSKVDFYSAFTAFVKKFENESSRVHSAMGSKTSELKKKTSAENGKKGGRPRKKID
ncbi:hypothetical protein J5681_06840 [bacterium]|nr:hypothetical protein [bacterium]